MTDSNLQFLNQLQKAGGGDSGDAPVAEVGKIQYTSHPIKRYRVGRFHFEASLLTLADEAEEAEFLAIIDNPKFPARERLNIKKLDIGAAEEISKRYRAMHGGATKQFDSSIGDRAEGMPKVGVGDLLKDQPTPESEADAGGGGAKEPPKTMTLPGSAPKKGA